LREARLAQLPPTPTPSGGDITFQNTIGPLLQGRCGGCRGASAIQGLDLTSYASALAGSQNGAVITPGDANTSRLVQVQRAAQPHFAQLSGEELQILVDWINAGAPE
jgi:hypothetical protein